MAKKFYFEITDVVEHARRHLHASGIQRVVLNVLKELCSRIGNGQVICVLYQRKQRRVVYFPAESIFNSESPDLESVLLRLGGIDTPVVRPPRAQVRAYLDQCTNKSSRSLRKAYVWLAARLFPSSLARLGMNRMQDIGICPPRVVPLLALEADGVLVRLGVNLQRTPMDDVAHWHCKSGGAVVSMIHDIIPVQYPDFFETEHARHFSDWLSRTLESSTKFLCVSSSTAKALCQQGGEQLSSKLVYVVPLAHELLGYARNDRVVLPTSISHERTSPFVLCVGTVEKRKNGASLVRAWCQLWESLRGKIPDLIFAGRRGWMLDEFESLLSGSHPALKKIVWLQKVTDQDLAWLYAHAEFTVFPSFYEGWGLPVGESAWFGKYCIASESGSVPEVCGSLIDYVDTSRSDELVVRLQYAIQNPAYVAAKEAQIREARLRTWKDVSEDIANILLQESGRDTSVGV